MLKLPLTDESTTTLASTTSQSIFGVGSVILMSLEQTVAAAGKNEDGSETREAIGEEGERRKIAYRKPGWYRRPRWPEIGWRSAWRRTERRERG